MVQEMSRDAWKELSKTILVRYILYVCGTLYLDPSASLKRSLHSLGGFLAFQPINLPE